MTYYKPFRLNDDGTLTNRHGTFIYEPGMIVEHDGDFEKHGDLKFNCFRHPFHCFSHQYLDGKDKLVIYEVEPIGKIKWSGWNKIDNYISCMKIKIGNRISLDDIYSMKTKHTEIHNGKKIHFTDGDPFGNIKVTTRYGDKVWIKDKKFHCDEVDPKTGLLLPTKTKANGIKEWYKDDKLHRDEVDPKTGLTLPAVINPNGTQIWYKDGKKHRIDIDPETGLTLPAYIYTYQDGKQHKQWWKDGKTHRDDIDPKTGKTLPNVITEDGTQQWWGDEGLIREKTPCSCIIS